MKKNKIPMRRCIGCMQSKPKRDLIRVVATPEGDVALDPGGKMNGRGAYVCPDPACLAKAQKKDAFSRSLNKPISEEEFKAVEAHVLEWLRENDIRTNQ